MNYAYFPGCSLHGTAVEYDESARAVAGSLGIDLVEIPDWTCCGSTPAHLTDDLLAVALPVKNILRAKEVSDQIAVCCAACYSRFKFANKHVQEKEDIRTQVGEVLGAEYSGDMRVRHFLDILINDVGLEKVAESVKRNLGGLKVACYYGCLLTRPPKVAEFDDPEDPTSLDNLMKTLGAEPISWPCKTECCGATFSLTKTDIVLKLSHDILAQAKKRGAEAIVLACPLCQANLDMRQSDINKRYGVEFDLPIFYFTQLLGLALGLDGADLGLKRAMVNPMNILKEKELV
ncbi:MAG: CoB--CoM heterodisulfide reductase iron-sulfur subunit B family protein [Candidatus Latescibacterota bacterium]